MRILFGGSFDLLHTGHVRAMRKAKRLDDYLIVLAVSDEEASHKKGKQRPIIPQEERVEMLNALRIVDEVYAEKGLHNMRKVLQAVEPDVLVLNTDARKEDVELCAEMGVMVRFIDRQIPSSGLDTSKIIKRILERYDSRDIS